MPTRKADFDKEELLATSQDHSKRLEDLERRLGNLENQISPETFGELFYTAQTSNKKVDEAIHKSVAAYDDHNIKRYCFEILKWVVAALIGGAVTWFFSNKG